MLTLYYIRFRGMGHNAYFILYRGKERQCSLYIIEDEEARGDNAHFIL